MSDAFDTEEMTFHGRRFLVCRYPDDSSDAPWEGGDGHGPVRWIRDSEPLERGETVLYDCPDGGRYVYDWGRAIVTAARDGWGLSPENLQRLTDRLGRKPTKAQIRAESVRQDMAFLRGWCADDWFYIGVGVRILGPDDEPIGDEFEHALWGLESCGDYWETVAAELAAEILADRRSAWRAALKERRARRYWASRDVSTVGA